MMNEEIKSPLVNKTVTIFPIKRNGGWLPPDHDGSALNSGAKIKKTGLLYDGDTRKRIDPLNDAEREWFYLNGKELGIQDGDLSCHKPINFWTKFGVDLSRDPLTLNLFDPMDFLRYKYLLAQIDIIAPSWEKRFDKGTYRFAIRDYDVEASTNVKKIAKEKEVNRHFYKIENDEFKLRALLKMYYYTKGTKRSIPSNANINNLTNDVYELIKNDLDKIYEIIMDPTFETKLLVHESVDSGKITKLSGSEYQIDGQDDVLTLTELVKFLEDKKNQHIKLKLENVLA
jgi:hypothetical protein